MKKIPLFIAANAPITSIDVASLFLKQLGVVTIEDPKPVLDKVIEAKKAMQLHPLNLKTITPAEPVFLNRAQRRKAMRDKNKKQ